MATAMFIARPPPGERDRTGQSARPDISTSSSSRNAKARSVTNAPSSPKTGHPPDVPDQGKAGDDGKEGVDEAGRRCSSALRSARTRALRRLTLLCARALLPGPIGVSAGDMRQDGKVPGRRRRRRRPFQRAAVPRIAGHVAELLAVADRHDELHDLADDPGQNDDGADRGHQQPRLPGRERRSAAGAGSCPSGPAHRAA